MIGYQKQIVTKKKKLHQNAFIYHNSIHHHPNLFIQPPSKYMFLWHVCANKINKKSFLKIKKNKKYQISNWLPDTLWQRYVNWTNYYLKIKNKEENNFFNQLIYFFQIFLVKLA